MPIYLTAIIKSRQEHIEEVRETLLGMVTESRKEEACLQYDLYQDGSDPGVFVFQEIWASPEGLALHNERPYIRAFAESLDKLQQKPEIYLIQPISNR
nr:putative quinol monooxygenase [uncultured Dyadobacter sp.]